MAQRCWRIAPDTPHGRAEDLAGTGARLSGGRWNRKGTAMGYASSSIALACLETVVHVAGGATLPLERQLVEITIPAATWQARTVFDRTRHPGWDALPAGNVSRDWGTAWATSATTLIALVPSVIIPEEWNLLINPAHPDIRRLKLRRLRRFGYDPRLVEER